ncbi:hypothetical protein ANN_13079 [Periplaneta americana]|uniref:Uncharacterized protein n=1 Tax=Periplaneta americana TaxID=6978 RepID=A0ABQ8TID7_PERAM|nr:hypothetical protein ANN_13079 [Periplaneta americana]
MKDQGDQPAPGVTSACLSRSERRYRVSLDLPKALACDTENGMIFFDSVCESPVSNYSVLISTTNKSWNGIGFGDAHKMSKIEMVGTRHKDGNNKESEDCLQQQPRWNQIKRKTENKMVELCTSGFPTWGKPRKKPNQVISPSGSGTESAGKRLSRLSYAGGSQQYVDEVLLHLGYGLHKLGLFEVSPLIKPKVLRSGERADHGTGPPLSMYRGRF